MILVPVLAGLMVAGAVAGDPPVAVCAPIVTCATGRLFVRGREVTGPFALEVVGRIAGSDTTWTLEANGTRLLFPSNARLPDSEWAGYARERGRELCDRPYDLLPWRCRGVLEDAANEAYRVATHGRIESARVDPTRARDLMVDILAHARPCVVAVTPVGADGLRVLWRRRTDSHDPSCTNVIRPFASVPLHPVAYYGATIVRPFVYPFGPKFPTTAEFQLGSNIPPEFALGAIVGSLRKGRIVIVGRTGTVFVCPSASDRRCLREIERLSAGLDPFRPRVIPRDLALEFTPEWN